MRNGIIFVIIYSVFASALRAETIEITARLELGMDIRAMFPGYRFTYNGPFVVFVSHPTLNGGVTQPTAVGIGGGGDSYPTGGETIPDFLMIGSYTLLPTTNSDITRLYVSTTFKVYYNTGNGTYSLHPPSDNECSVCGNDPCTCECPNCGNVTCTCPCPVCGNDPCTCVCPRCRQDPCVCTCTCGACCSCRCTCGEWNGPACGGTGDDCNCHKECTCCCSCTCDCRDGWTGVTCTGHASDDCDDNNCNVWGEQYHCDCHKKGGGDGECCEHHYKKYTRPPDVNYGSIPDLEIPGMGGRTPEGRNYNIPSAPPEPELDVPEVEEAPFEYFERGEGRFPRFRYEKAFGELQDKLNEKIPLDWLGSMNPAGGTGAPSLMFVIDFEVMRTRVGPWRWDLAVIIAEIAAMEIFRIIRMILVFLLSLYAIMTILGLVFHMK